MDLTDSKIVRYLKRADVVSENSHDSETKVGSILVSKKTWSAISEGFNGFVRGAPDFSLPCTRPDKYDYMIHAEENLICNAARNGVNTNECVVFQTHSPCPRCMRLLFQSGIDTVYYTNLYRTTLDIKKYNDLKIDIEDNNIYGKITIKRGT